jgi:precorrin-2 dehydrogenase/sirohydrochlorin ferrochelatase
VKLLPVALQVAEKRCLLVGGGPVAERKARALLECGAQVRVIALELCACFAPLRSQIEYSQRAFQSGDCHGFDLVFACTDRNDVNAAVADEAHNAHIWCNIADDPQSSDLHTVAALRHDDICIGISTGAASPVLARHLKEQIATVIGEEYAQLLQIVSEARSGCEASSHHENSGRGDMWRTILASDALRLLRAGQTDEAKTLVVNLLK